MAQYIDLQGIQTWYDEVGGGEPLVLLHPGGIGVDSRVFRPNMDGLSAQLHLFLPERRGHGHTPDADGPYTYELVADDMIRFIEKVVGGGPVRLLGMSDGAIVGLIIARKRPDLVNRLACIAGVYHNEGWAPGVINPDPEPPEFLLASFAEVTPDGQAQVAAIKKKLNQMHTDGPKLTTTDLAAVKLRTLVMIGDDDEVILEHALSFYRSLPNGELAVVPGTSHGLLVEKPELCNQIILDFLTNEPITTLAPIRRRA